MIDMKNQRRIVIYGGDCYGKSTFSEKLMADQRDIVIFTHFPNYGSKYGKRIKKNLHSGKELDMIEFLDLKMLYSLDRHDYFEKLNGNVREDKIYLYDRFIRDNSFHTIDLKESEENINFVKSSIMATVHIEENMFKSNRETEIVLVLNTRDEKILRKACELLLKRAGKDITGDLFENIDSMIEANNRIMDYIDEKNHESLTKGRASIWLPYGKYYIDILGELPL